MGLGWGVEYLRRYSIVHVVQWEFSSRQLTLLLVTCNKIIQITQKQVQQPATHLSWIMGRCVFSFVLVWKNTSRGHSTYLCRQADQSKMNAPVCWARCRWQGCRLLKLSWHTREWWPVSGRMAARGCSPPTGRRRHKAGSRPGSPSPWQ